MGIGRKFPRCIPGEGEAEEGISRPPSRLYRPSSTVDLPTMGGIVISIGAPEGERLYAACAAIGWGDAYGEEAEEVNMDVGKTCVPGGAARGA